MIIERLKCLRCGYEWYPKTPEPPKTCANKKCRSPYWNKPKVKQSGPQRIEEGVIPSIEDITKQDISGIRIGDFTKQDISGM